MIYPPLKKKRKTNMKKLILLLMAFAALANGAAWGQSFYGEWRRKGSGELNSKVWHTPERSRTETTDKDGKSISIIDMKAKKIYHLNEARKTCMVIENTDELSTNKILGYDLTVSRHSSRKFIGMEEIDGKQCAHYYVTSEKLNKDGNKEFTSYNEWIYEPMKSSSYSGCIAHDNSVYFKDDVVVLRNVRMGPQPDYLFEVPEGYKMTVMPAGGLLEMVTGKSRKENTQYVDKAMKGAKGMIDDFDKNVKDTTKSKEDRLKSFLELLEKIEKK